MSRIFTELLSGYGSFFGLTNRISQSLLLVTSLLNPITGLYGMLGGLSVMLARRLLGGFPKEEERLDMVNGILFGMLIGSSFAGSKVSFFLIALGSFLVVSMSATIKSTIGKFLKLPILGLPYVLSASIVLPLAAIIREPLATAVHIAGLDVFHIPFPNVWSALGSLYFCGTPTGGVLVFVAFLISSRYLAFLALGSALLSTMYLTTIGVTPGSLSFLVAQMNGVLAASIIGGLYAVPSSRSLMIAALCTLQACTLSITLERILWVVALPVLAFPFVLSTYITMIALGAERGGPWPKFWLATPDLPERSTERIAQAEARGVDFRSVGLKLPVSGVWQVYQGFNGPHTHKGPWQYAIDLFQTKDGHSFKNDGAELSDYFCYGKPVLSPAYGAIVAIESSFSDNQPGEVDTTNNWGNYVLIALDSGQHVLLAHLQKDSVRVLLGSRVTPGQVLALCGNSGRSPQPHLHMHVQLTSFVGDSTVPFHLAGVIEPSKKTQTFYLNYQPNEGTVLLSPTRNIALRRALRLRVGSQFNYDTQRVSLEAKSRHLSECLTVSLDLGGQFWIHSGNGAKAAFHLTDDLLAVFGRTGPKNDFLDALILSIGLTPMVEGTLTWHDKVPNRILPLSPLWRFLLCLFQPFDSCTLSTYNRRWDPKVQCFIQTGNHSVAILFGVLKWSCETEAHLCEVDGLVRFKLTILTNSLGSNSLQGTKNLSANLAVCSLQEDNGIPEMIQTRSAD